MPAISVSTHKSGSLVAGEMYTLTCAVVELIDGLTGMPTLQWINSEDSPLVTGDGITVSELNSTDTSATLTLVFNPLRTSHGGKYICRAMLESPPVEGGIVDSITETVIVQSE